MGDNGKEIGDNGKELEESLDLDPATLEWCAFAAEGAARQIFERNKVTGKGTDRVALRAAVGVLLDFGSNLRKHAEQIREPVITRCSS